MKLLDNFKKIWKLASLIEFKNDVIIFKEDLNIKSLKNINLASNFENIDPSTNQPYRLNFNCRKEIDGILH